MEEKYQEESKEALATEDAANTASAASEENKEVGKIETNEESPADSKTALVQCSTVVSVKVQH